MATRSSSETIPSAIGGVHAPVVSCVNGRDAGAVHLADEADAIARQLQEVRDARPLAVVAPKLEVCNREQVPGVWLEREADERPSPWSLRPFGSRQ